ncbi:hypothetical protein RhiirC2_857686 [Rhizophagus irregularis]|uniref:Uncharacterized protein n=1 Tax=Rhizophagus irregularis TaxID=588596 RepID=A0A2N1MAK9_9GLOM|nr:hypothetical protein RhiirC2_857686 [Rhizophagus irregularis]
MWIIIFEIIKTLSLDVNILLVQENDLNFSIFNQHLKDKYNYIQHLGINIKTTLIKFFPNWNGVPIELSLRKYLKIYTNIFNLEQFLNLNRNYKYRKLQVDWEITFYLLQGDQENQALYVEDIDLPDLPYIWDNSIREDFFTSIDIIKGIIPLSLCKFINGKLKNYKKTKEILYNFRKISFNLIRDFWNERCSVYHEINIALGITKNVLKEQYGKEKCITTKKPPTDKKYNDTEGLVNYIRYGGKIIDYYNCCVL